MLLPKIHKNSMLPRTCDQLPWTNMDERMLSAYGTRGVGGGLTLPISTPGTKPKCRKKRPSCSPEPSVSSHSHTRPFARISRMVTRGNVRVGLSSRRGSMSYPTLAPSRAWKQVQSTSGPGIRGTNVSMIATRFLRLAWKASRTASLLTGFTDPSATSPAS